MSFTKIDNLLLKYSSKLGLSPIQVQIIVNVLSFKYGDELPYPSNRKIANRIGRCGRTIERNNKKLEQKGFLRRTKGGIKPCWDFSGLFKRLNELGNPDNNVGVECDINIDNTDTSDTQHRQNCHTTPTVLTTNTDICVARIRSFNNNYNKTYKKKELFEIWDSLNSNDKSIINTWTNQRVGFGCRAASSKLDELRLTEIEESMRENRLIYNQKLRRYELNTII